MDKKLSKEVADSQHHDEDVDEGRREGELVLVFQSLHVGDGGKGEYVGESGDGATVPYNRTNLGQVNIEHYAYAHHSSVQCHHMHPTGVDVPKSEVHDLYPQDVDDEGKEGDHLEEEEHTRDHGQQVVASEVVQQVILNAVFLERETDKEHPSNDEVRGSHQQVCNSQITSIFLGVFLVPHDGQDTIVDEERQRQGAHQNRKSDLEQRNKVDRHFVNSVKMNSPFCSFHDNEYNEINDRQRPQGVELGEEGGRLETDQGHQDDGDVEGDGGVHVPVPVEDLAGPVVREEGVDEGGVHWQRGGAVHISVVEVLYLYTAVTKLQRFIRIHSDKVEEIGHEHPVDNGSSEEGDEGEEGRNPLRPRTQQVSAEIGKLDGVLGEIRNISQADYSVGSVKTEATHDEHDDQTTGKASLLNRPRNTE